MNDKIQLILPTSWEPNREEFLSALGVSRPGGLGAQIFGTVYEALFVTSTELKSEFDKYYSVEYASLQEYVEICYGKAMDEDILGAERVYLVSWLPISVNPEMHVENILETVLQCIKNLETQDESEA